jgi:hypothetical protein
MSRREVRVGQPKEWSWLGRIQKSTRTRWLGETSRPLRYSILYGPFISSRVSADINDIIDGQPTLGKLLGAGKFGTVYDSPDDTDAVIKVMKYWSTEMRHRFLYIYSIIKEGKPFKPGNGNDDQYLLMIAFELRNLHIIGQLKSPKPENFTGWFTMTKIGGTPLWKTPLYKKHPFSVPFQRLLKTAFHLIVDEIEYTIKKYGIEHRYASIYSHLGNCVILILQRCAPCQCKFHYAR